MRRSIGVAMVCVVAALATEPACGDGSGEDDVVLQRLETVMCEKWVECGCATVPVECGGWPSDLRFVEYRGNAALAFDPVCVEQWWSWVDTLSCETPALPRYADLCPLYHGTLREAEPCQANALPFTECGRGLLCIADECRDPQATLVGAVDQPCELGAWCEDGLACISDWCRRLPSSGEACLQGRCDAGADCVADRCVGLPGPGQPCPDFRCQPGARCEADPSTGERACEPLADVGQPCMGHGDCISGNCPAGSCEDPAQAGDPCSNRLPCGPGLLCDQGICRSEGEGLVPTLSACSILDAI